MLDFPTFYILQLVKSLSLHIPEALKKNAPFGPPLPVNSAFMQHDCKTLVCDKRDRPITFVFCCDLHLS